MFLGLPWGMIREEIPARVKRAVRQRCGFGCVFCGSPVFEYEHIDGYKVTGNDPDRMTLLCRFHHGEKTLKRLPKVLVERANAFPHNQTKSFGSKTPLFYCGDHLNVILGGNNFSCKNTAGDISVVRIDGEDILRVRFFEGNPVIDLILRDQDDKVLLTIRKGQLRYSTENWDVTFVAQTLKLRNGPRKIAFVIKFEVPETIIINHADLWARGVYIKLGKLPTPDAKSEVGLRIMNEESANFSGSYVHATKCMVSVGVRRRGEIAALYARAETRWLGGLPAPAGAFSQYDLGRGSEAMSVYRQNGWKPPASCPDFFGLKIDSDRRMVGANSSRDHPLVSAFGPRG